MRECKVDRCGLLGGPAPLAVLGKPFRCAESAEELARGLDRLTEINVARWTEYHRLSQLGSATAAVSVRKATFSFTCVSQYALVRCE